MILQRLLGRGPAASATLLAVLFATASLVSAPMPAMAHEREALELPEEEAFRLAADALSRGLVAEAARRLPACSPEGKLSLEEQVAAHVQLRLWKLTGALAAASGDLVTALAALHRARDCGDAGDLPLILAEAHVEAGEVSRAVKLISDVESLPRAARPRALALLAEHGAAIGSREVAREAWLQLLFRHPEDPAARDAYGRVLDLSLPGDEMPALAEWIGRLERLHDGHYNEMAIEAASWLLPLVEEGGPQCCRISYLLGSAHRKARNYREAIEVLGPVTSRCSDDELLREASWVRASATWILEGDPAVPLFRAFADAWPDHPDADRALYLVAALHHRRGRPEEARATLREQLERWPEGSMARAALWRSFWIGREEGGGARDLPLLRELIGSGDAPGSSFHRERAMYWKARVLAQSGREETAAALLADLALEHPLSYYWLQAVLRLRELDPEGAKRLEVAFPSPGGGEAESHGDPLRSIPEAQAGRVLLELGLPAAAASMLREAEDDVAELGAAAVTKLAFWMSLARDPHRSHWLVRTRVRAFAARWPEGEHAAVWRAAYPLAFADLVRSAAAEAKIDPLLLHAVIREESALLPDAVSWAGAVGLAQMMPRTAADVAMGLGVEGPVDRRRLVDPALNLRIAARRLSDLLDLFGDNTALAIAAYNAGERTVMGWVLDLDGVDLDVFVESIRIAETQRYTRRVLRSWATYRWLYAEEERMLELPARAEVPR